MHKIIALSAVRSMAQLLHREWVRHSPLIGTPEYDEKLSDMNTNIRSGEIREDLFRASLLDLSRLLQGHYGAPAVILIDEYDSPLMHAWLKGYYEFMADIKPSLEALMRGQTFYAQIDEFLTFRGLDTSPNAVLSLLYFAGYLRAEGQKVVDRRINHELAVPNEEVRLAYEDTVLDWFREDLAEAFGDPLLQALLSGDVSAVGDYLADLVMRVFSYYDTAKNQAEHFYHAFLLGLLVRLDRQYRIRSNGESGLGRYDIWLIPKDR